MCGAAGSTVVTDQLPDFRKEVLILEKCLAGYNVLPGARQVLSFLIVQILLIRGSAGKGSKGQLCFVYVQYLGV